MHIHSRGIFSLQHQGVCFTVLLHQVPGFNGQRYGNVAVVFARLIEGNP